MTFFAKLTKQSDHFYLVEFPDLNGCYTEGKNLKKALVNGKEALDGWLASNCDRNLKIPKPKKRTGKSYYPIEVDLRIAFAIMIREIRLEKGLSQKEVAKLLGISQQAYSKLEAPLKTNPSLSTIQKLSEALDVDFIFDFAA